MESIEKSELVIALHKAMSSSFNGGHWKELGYLTGTDDQINMHPRLLRSLKWGDPDYDEHVYWAIEMIIQRDPSNMKKMIEYVKFEDWLREHEPKLYSQLYGTGHLPTAEIEKAGTLLGVSELNRQIDRIRKSIDIDPDLAIGSAKELLETVFKTVLGLHGQKIGDDDLPALWRKVRKKLGLDLNGTSEDAPGAKSSKRLLGSLNQIVHSVAEMRNLHGTGHGKAKSKEAEKIDAKLVVNSSITMANYVFELWKLQE